MSRSKLNTINIDKSLCTEESLKGFLNNKSNFSESERNKIKFLIDTWNDCWKLWNKVRWDAAMNSDGVKELKKYLGSEFIPYYDSSWQLAKEWLSKDRNSKKLIEEFYKKTRNYIYNSIIFHYSKDRMNLKIYWTELKKKYKINSVIDYGCGTGNDGLEMLNEGMKVCFSDFKSPTLDFIKWRLNERKYPKSQYKVLDVESLRKKPVSADMFWTIDVIEHMENPLEIFDCISKDTKLVVYFTDCDDKAGGRHPFHFRVNKDLLENEFKKRNYKKIEHKILDVWLLK